MRSDDQLLHSPPREGHPLADNWPQAMAERRHGVGQLVHDLGAVVQVGQALDVLGLHADVTTQFGVADLVLAHGVEQMYLAL